MSKNAELLARRDAVVPRGVGVFHDITAESAEGAVITDAEGNRYIDFAGGIGVLNAGHCPAPVVEAIQKQAEKLIHTCFSVATYESYIALCEKLVELFPHGDRTKVMLTNTGAESVENAVKIARQYTKRQAIISFSEAFHGRSMMAMSLTSKISYKHDCGPFAPEVYRVPFPNYYHKNDGLDYDTFIARELGRLEETMYNTVAPENVAAIIIEPVQGEGGFFPVPREYMLGLRDFCDKYGIVLIADEVQSGFGRTGKWAAYQHYGIEPDLSTWAKSMGGGMPVGCVIGKAEIMDGARPGTLGGTYPGNPVACEAALATINYMEQIDICKRGEEVGNYIRQRFLELQAKCPLVGDVRGLGAMIAMELVRNRDPRQPAMNFTPDLLKACYERGLLIINAGVFKNIVRILCPLVITDEQLKQGLDIIEEETLRLYHERKTDLELIGTVTDIDHHKIGMQDDAWT